MQPKPLFKAHGRKVKTDSRLSWTKGVYRPRSSLPPKPLNHSEEHNYANCSERQHGANGPICHWTTDTQSRRPFESQWDGDVYVRPQFPRNALRRARAE